MNIGRFGERWIMMQSHDALFGSEVRVERRGLEVSIILIANSSEQADHFAAAVLSKLKSIRIMRWLFSSSGSSNRPSRDRRLPKQPLSRPDAETLYENLAALQVISKSEFAALKKRTRACISNWISAGKITPHALVGEGYRAKIIVERAEADLAAALSPSQQSWQPFPANGSRHRAPSSDDRYARNKDAFQAAVDLGLVDPFTSATPAQIQGALRDLDLL